MRNLEEKNEKKQRIAKPKKTLLVSFLISLVQKMFFKNKRKRLNYIIPINLGFGRSPNCAPNLTEYKRETIYVLSIIRFVVKFACFFKLLNQARKDHDSKRPHSKSIDKKKR